MNATISLRVNLQFTDFVSLGGREENRREEKNGYNLQFLREGPLTLPVRGTSSLL